MKANPLRTLRRRHGLYYGCVTALVLCLFVLSALLFDRIEARYALRLDYSFNGAATQSRVTTQQLRQLDKDVHVYVLSSAGNQDNTLSALLTRYAAVTPRFTFSEENAARSPALLTAFEDELSLRQVQSDCLIVHCDETGRSRVLISEDFITYTYDGDTGYYQPTGVNYDKPLTEAIVYTAQSEPLTLQLLRGHQETAGDDLAVMEQVLTQANYALREVNLLSGDTLDIASPLLILSPQLDISEKELALLMDFADRGGDFFILSDYTDPLDNGNYNALLRAYGVSFYPGLCMAMPEDTKSYYDQSPAFLMPRMQDTALTKPLIASGRDTLLMPGSRAVYLPSALPEGVTVEPLIITGQSYIRDYVHVEPDVTAMQPTDEQGYFALSVLCSRVSAGGDVSHAMVTGNAEMFTHWWIEENTYSADYLKRGLVYMQGESPISLDIAGKTGVRQMLTFGSLLPLILASALLPLLVMLFALRVLIPRRHL